jgi:hypothetical protein
MNDKREFLSNLRGAFNSWETLLAGKNEEGVNAQPAPVGWSIKDVIAHLTAWQQISIARLEAALLNTTPVFPGWLAGADPFYAEDHADEFNSRIYVLRHDLPRSVVHRDWKDGFQRFLELADDIPDKEMFDALRYPWLNGYALSSVLEGAWEHHQEHFDDVFRRVK